MQSNNNFPVVPLQYAIDNVTASQNHGKCMRQKDATNKKSSRHCCGVLYPPPKTRKRDAGWQLAASPRPQPGSPRSPSKPGAANFALRAPDGSRHLDGREQGCSNCRWLATTDAFFNYLCTRFLRRRYSRSRSAYYCRSRPEKLGKIVTVLESPSQIAERNKTRSRREQKLLVQDVIGYLHAILLTRNCPIKFKHTVPAVDRPSVQGCAWKPGLQKQALSRPQTFAKCMYANLPN